MYEFNFRQKLESLNMMLFSYNFSQIGNSDIRLFGNRYLNLKDIEKFYKEHKLLKKKKRLPKYGSQKGKTPQFKNKVI